jgi:hypothetical protein
MPKRSAVLAFLLLGACASFDPARDTRGWFMHAEAGEAKLVYGTPHSDDVPLMMDCTAGSGRVAMSQSALRPGDGVTLSAGRTRTVFYGEAEPDEMNGGVFVTAETDAATPVLAAFRDGGGLAIEEAGRVQRLPATAQEREEIRRFFAACGRSQLAAR